MTHHCLSAGLCVLCMIPIAMMSQSLPADDTTMSVLIAVVSSSLGEWMTAPCQC